MSAKLFLDAVNGKPTPRPAVDAGINIVGPECAVPLSVKVENLKAVSEVVKGSATGE